MSKEEIRGVTGGKVMQCLLCNQEDLVVCSVFYRTPMEGCQNGVMCGRRQVVVKKWCVCILNQLEATWRSLTDARVEGIKMI